MMRLKIISLIICTLMLGTVLLAAIPVSVNGQTDVWVEKSPMPTGRGGLAVGVVNDTIYAIGGRGGGKELNVNEEYDPTTDTWRVRAPMPTARSHFTIAVMDDKIYAIGGRIYDSSYGSGWRSLNTVECYDPSSDSWSSREQMPTPRTGMASGTANNRIFVMGGHLYNSDGSITDLNVNEEYDPINDTWTIKALLLTARTGLAVGVVNNYIYAIGGQFGVGPRAVTEEYNPITNSWVTKTPMPAARSWFAIGVKNNRIYAIGGSDLNERYDVDNDEWNRKAPMPTGRSSLGIGVVNDKIYAIGGYPELNINEEYTIEASNNPPIADAGLDQTVNEGDVVQFDGSSSYDPDGTIVSYEWDFDSSDGLWWETGAISDAIGSTPTHSYGDDGVYIVTLRVTDNDNLSATDTCNVIVQNVDPTVTIESINMDVEIGLRVAGRKYNDVGMTLYEDSNPIGYVSIERMPGSPDDQMAWIPVSINFSKSYSAIVTYTPEDPPNIGANPVWIYIKSQNGSIKKIHHTFNIQQSKKRDSEHWNHVEPWEVELDNHFIGLPFEITSHITDPGSDDEILTFTYGSQVVNVTYLNNPPNSDPYPSPEVNPVDIMDTTTLIYEGPGTVTLVVKDDDNLRLGVGEGIDIKSVG